MAEFIRSKVSKYTSASTTTAGVWPSHSSGTLLVVAYMLESNADDISDSSNTNIGGGAASGGGSANTIEAYYKVAASSSETNPSATHSSVANRAAITFAIDGVNATPIDTSAAGTENTNSSPYNYAKFFRGTTTVNDVLCLHVTISDQGINLSLDPGPTGIANEYVVDGSCDVAAAWLFQKTAGLTPDFGWSFAESINNGFTMMIPVRMDIDVPRVASSPACADMIHNGSYQNTSGSGGHLSFTNTNIASTITAVDGLTTMTYSASNASGIGVNPFITLPVCTTGTNERLGLLGMNLDDGPFDATGKKILMQPVAVQGLHNTRTLPAEEHGMVCGLKSGTNEYRLYDAGGSDTRCHEAKPVIVDSASGGIHDENTLDFSDITGISVGIYRTNNQTQVGCDKAWILNTIPLEGGESGTPCDWEVAYNHVQRLELNSIQRLGNAYETGHDIQVGPSVYFDSNGKSLSGMPSESATDKRFQAAETTVTFYGDASSTIHLTKPLANLTIIVHASSSSSADWSWATSFTECDVSSAVDIGPISGAVFDSCATFSDDSLDMSGGCTITGNTVSHDVEITGATAAALQAKLDQYANCTIGRLHVSSTFAGDISLDFDSITVTTLTYTSSQSASEITAVMQNGSTVANQESTDDEVITISNDVTLTVNISETGAEVTLLQRGTQTEIDHTETAGTSYTYTYTYSSDTNADLSVFLPGYKADWNDSLVLGSTDQTISVTLVPEPAYES